MCCSTDVYSLAHPDVPVNFARAHPSCCGVADQAVAGTPTQRAAFLPSFITASTPGMVEALPLVGQIRAVTAPDEGRSLPYSADWNFAISPIRATLPTSPPKNSATCFATSRRGPL